MAPVLELPVGRVLLAVNPITDPTDLHAPRADWDRYPDGSWWIEIRLFGHIVGLYR
jgi:hypothetical protein